MNNRLKYFVVEDSNEIIVFLKIRGSSKYFKTIFKYRTINKTIKYSISIRTQLEKDSIYIGFSSLDKICEILSAYFGQDDFDFPTEEDFLYMLMNKSDCNEDGFNPDIDEVETNNRIKTLIHCGFNEHSEALYKNKEDVDSTNIFVAIGSYLYHTDIKGRPLTEVRFDYKIEKEK